MTNDLDQKLGRLLREGAPPQRDPMFRIGLIERRARQRYQRRQRVVLASAAVLAVLFAIIVTLGDRLLTAGLVAAFCTVVIAASVFSFRGLQQVMRQLRD